MTSLGSLDESNIRFNEVQWKAAHNSVERDESIFEQLEIDDGNCGAIELDFVVDKTSVILNAKQEVEKLDATEQQKYEGWRFAVQHDEEYSSKNSPLNEVFRTLLKWSEAHPNHTVVTVHLDLKGGGAYYGDHGEFAVQLDRAISWGLPRKHIFTPGDLQRDAPNVLEGAKKYGWPLLKDLQNKFILVISGSDKDPPVRARRDTYSTTNPLERLCFVDIDQRGCLPTSQNTDILNPHYQKGDRVFVNIMLGNNDWCKLGRGAYKNGFVSRVWKANKESDWKASKDANIHYIATDKIRKYPWASINSKHRFAVIPK